MEIYIIFAVLLAAFLFLAWIQRSGPVLTGPAAVVSRRAEVAKYPGRMQLGVETQGWNYLVTFRLSDGDEIELYVSQEEFKLLKEGLTGQLTWHKDTMSSFEPDKEVSV